MALEAPSNTTPKPTNLVKPYLTVLIKSQTTSLNNFLVEDTSTGLPVSDDRSGPVLVLNSQCSSSHQGLHVSGVDLQGFVVLVHGFDVTAVFEVVDTCTHAAKSKVRIWLILKSTGINTQKKKN